MASTVVDSSFELNHLFRDISTKFSPLESAEVVKSSKRIYGEQFSSLQNEDLLSCFGLMQKFGYVSNSKLTLIKDFVASKSSNKENISESIESFIASHPPLYDPEKRLQGRNDDLKRIRGTLEDLEGQSSVVNLHGPGGVGKTTLAQEICSEWRGKSYVFDLRKSKDMIAIYHNLMNKLDLTVRVGYVDMSFVVEKIIEKAFEEREGLPVLFLLDNVEEFTSGQGKEGRNLKMSFMMFLEKLIGYDKDRKARPLRILLTSRTPLNVDKVDDYELQPLRDTFSEKILLSDKTVDINMVQKEKLLSACNGKPLLLKGLAAILKQGRKLPSDLINEIEKFIRVFEEKGDTLKSKSEEDAKEKAYPYEEGVGHNEKSVIHEMFNTLPSDCLKESAVSLSLFCGPFSAFTAAQVLDISLPEAVAQLEGLETSAIIFVVNREQKELMYDIHPLLKKYADSIKDDERFIESYAKARKQFHDHFMSKVKIIAGFVEADYVKAFTMFTSDNANYEFAIDISLEPEYFSTPDEFHERALILSLVNAMLSNEKKTELFNSWAELCRDDGMSGSLFRAHLKCWESLYVRDKDGPSEAFKVLEQAANSLGKVQDTTAENFTQTQGLYSYFEGEIYYKKSDFKKALDCLQLSLDLMEKLPQVDDILSRCYNAMGNCYYGLKNLTKALEFYTKALKMTENELKGGEYHYSLPVYKNQIGTVYHGQGNYDKAVEYYKEAIRLLEVLKISGYEDEADFCRNLANAYVFQDKFEEAMKPADKAYEIRRKRLGDHPDTVRSIFQQGLIQANLKEPEKALNFFRNAWEMEKSLKAGNHSEVWKKLIDTIIDYIADDSQKKDFKKEALAFCQRFWKEERASLRFGFTESNRLIIDTVVELLGDTEGERDVQHEYEKEKLSFYDGFQGETEKDFYTTFDEATDNRQINKMLKDRVELLDKIINLCIRLDMHETRSRHTGIKLNLYRKVLFKTNFVGEKGYEKEALKSEVEQMYGDLGERESITEFRKALLSSWRSNWEQREGIEETTETMSSLARERTIRGILQLCLDLNEKKLHRRYGEEALLFYEELWTRKWEEMDKRAIKKFLRDIKALASSVGDDERKDLYQDVLQKFINTGEKPATLGPKEAALAQGSVSGEEEEEEEDEEIEVTSEKSEEDEEVDLTSDEEIEVSSQDEVSFQDENEFLSPFRDTNEDSIVICSGEVVKEGTRWDPKEVAVHVIFPSGAVSEDRILKLVRWNPRARCPPLLHQEDIVSDVIELSEVDSPSIQHFNEAVTIVIPHCASNLKGYEVVIKTLINSENNEWDDIVETEDLRTKHDIKGDHAGSGDVPDLLFPVAISKITQCSTFVVVCRLRSHEHTITSQESELVWPEFPLARISFPQNAVPRDESFEVIAKLQEVSQKLFKKKQILPGPILRITSPRAVDFLKPVTIQLPLSLGERCRRGDIDMSLVRVRVLLKESSSEEEEWIEITDKLETPPRFDGDIITFEVRHFSVLWTLVDWCWNKLPLAGGAGAVIDQTVEPEVKKLDSVPKAASFLAFVPGDTRLHQTSQLRLYCVPTCKKPEVEEIEGKKDNVVIGDGSSDELMYFNDKAFMFLSEGIVAAIRPERLRKFHVSLQDEPFLKSLKIRVENRGDLIVSFFKSQEKDEDNMLCELEVTLPPQRADPDKTPVEFFGLRLRDTTFDEAPFDDSYGILTACRGVLNEINKRQIYEDHLELSRRSIMGLRDVKEKFLAELSKLPQEHKERCFDKIVSGLEEGGEGLKHIRDRLLEARAKINEQISRRICDVVAEKMQKGTSWITLARDLEPKIPESDIDELQENEVSPKECCRIALRKWYQRFTFQATSQELMRCLTNMGFANLNWHIMKELGLVLYEDIPESER
ncbi:uncharacterized protein [Montipora foliosa]|uniref:uncharacterized protein isoform X2 n=1 Tax=Montipora foliosa TaxID=591990 RepID=UPI0035F1E412